MGRTTPTQRTLAEFKRFGFRVGVVERFIPVPPHGIRKDYLGFIDLIALAPRTHEIIGVQCCAGSGHAEHKYKIAMECRDAAMDWLRCGGRIELWSWSKVGGRWTSRVERITESVMLEVSASILKKVAEHEGEWSTCTRCSLGPLAHKHVLWKGQVPAELLFIGEAPGQEEDASGLPFVGRAGLVLQRILEHVEKDFRPFKYCITNVLGCRPEDNRDPLPEEVEICFARVQELKALVRPKAVVLLGKQAAAAHNQYGWHLPYIELYHPAYIIRQGSSKRVELIQRTVAKIGNLLKEVGR